MSLIIDIMDETNTITDTQKELVARLLNYAAEEENVEADSEVSLTFVNNTRIQEVNKEYRHKDSPTDVISFAMEEQGEGEIKIKGNQMPTLLGDILISVDRMVEQAEEYGHSVERELGFLAVHGFLHLLGYDHMNEADEKIMFGRQRNILDRFGLER